MAYCCLGGLAEFLQRYGGLGAGPTGGGSWEELRTRGPTERGEVKGKIKAGRTGAPLWGLWLRWAERPARGLISQSCRPLRLLPPASSSVWSDSMRTQESESCYRTLTSAGPSPWSTAGPPSGETPTVHGGEGQSWGTS